MAVLADVTQGIFYWNRTASLGSAMEEKAPIDEIWLHSGDKTQFQRHVMQGYAGN